MTHAAVDIDARADLRAALAERNIAFDTLTKATAAAKRARELLERDERRFRQFATLENEIASDTAARVMAWAAEGGAEPNLSPVPKFAGDRRERAEGEQKVAAARTAVASLDAALSDAKRKFASAELRVSAAATAVLVQEAGPLGERLMRARREVWELEDVLTALGANWFPNGAGIPRPVPLGQGIVDALHGTERPWRKPGATSESDAWRALHDALCRGDLSARLESPSVRTSSVAPLGAGGKSESAA
jgi:hypothetical protein